LQGDLGLGQVFLGGHDGDARRALLIEPPSCEGAPGVPSRQFALRPGQSPSSEHANALLA
jgi:hypothetical protein